MNNILKKILQFIIGLFYIGRDKTKEILGNLEKEGVFDENSSKQVVKDTVQDAKGKIDKTTKQVKEKFEKIRSKGDEDIELEEDENLEE